MYKLKLSLILSVFTTMFVTSQVWAADKTSVEKYGISEQKNVENIQAAKYEHVDHEQAVSEKAVVDEIKDVVAESEITVNKEIEEQTVLPPVIESEAIKTNMPLPSDQKIEPVKAPAPPVVSVADSNNIMVNVVSTADQKTVYGKLKVTELSDGLLIEGKFTGVPDPGKHGIHVHENGSCEDKGSAAGGHFNPDGHQHGDLAMRGHAEAHAGDMGNVLIDEKGNGNFSFLLKASSLREGRYNVGGKSIILHEKEDDFGQPTGNAGGRIGCGIIPKP